MKAEIKELQVQILAEPAQIKLIRQAKGYGWEINLHGENLTNVSEEIKRIDDLFRDRYGQEQKPIQEVKK